MYLQPALYLIGLASLDKHWEYACLRDDPHMLHLQGSTTTAFAPPLYSTPSISTHLASVTIRLFSQCSCSSRLFAEAYLSGHQLQRECQSSAIDLILAKDGILCSSQDHNVGPGLLYVSLNPAHLLDLNLCSSC